MAPVNTPAGERLPRMPVTPQEHLRDSVLVHLDALPALMEFWTRSLVYGPTSPDTCQGRALLRCLMEHGVRNLESPPASLLQQPGHKPPTGRF